MRRPGLAHGVRFQLLRRRRLATPKWSPLLAELVLPLLVGAAGAVRGSGAVEGRRIARLAAVSAGLGLYLYGVTAVVILGPAGPPADPGSTAGYIISDRLSSNMIANLVAIPLVTATIGWAAAAATARLRPHLAAEVVSVPVTAAGPGAGIGPVPAPSEAVMAIGVPRWRRTAWLLLLCAAVAAAVFLAAVSGLRG
jgi:hypothetical protein